MNSEKWHLLMTGHKFEQIWAEVGTDLNGKVTQLNYQE